MFKVYSSKKIFHANNLENIFNTKIKNSYPYVVRKTSDNGIKGYIIEDEKYLNSANTLSFAQDTFTVFYQKEKYFTGNKVKILKPKFKNNSEKIMTYLTSCFQKSLSIFSWGVGSNVESILKTKISLPTKNGQIDFEFMEDFITELETQRITELEAYLKATGLSNYKLTKVEEEAIEIMNGGGTI